MNVVFYTSFAKKDNSTKQPTGGTTFNCVLKDSSGVLSPQIEISTTGNPRSYNYAYISDFGRYYYVEEWTYYRGVWTASLKVDVLASWKDSIGAATLYINRSSFTYNGKIVDGLFPMKAEVLVRRSNIPGIFYPGYEEEIWDSGFYVVGLIVRNDVQYIGCTSANLAKLFRSLFSDAYFESVSNMTSITPEIKTQINPFQYVTKILYIPAPIMAGVTSTAWGYFKYASYQSVTSLKVGLGTCTFANDDAFGYYDFLGAYMSRMKWPIPLDDLGFHHPQADTRGNFLRSAPYTKWSLYLPPFGLIDLPSDEMTSASYVFLDVTADVRTGAARLKVTAKNGALDPYPETVIVTTSANCGVEHPIAGVFTPGHSLLSMVGPAIGGISSAASGNYAGAVGGFFSAAINGIQAYAAGTVPHVSKITSQGSGSEMIGNGELVAQFIPLVDDDLPGRGRPLCEEKQISTIPGFISADPDRLEVPCTSGEYTQICEYVSTGFFYE